MMVLKKQTENRLTDYLSWQRKLNYDITKDEEIDFEALANYIKTELIYKGDMEKLQTAD